MTTPLILTLLPLVLTSALEVLEWLVELPVEIFRAYSSLLRWAADSVQDLFEEYGYWVVFFGTLSENTLLVGLIVPGALVVILLWVYYSALILFIGAALTRAWIRHNGRFIVPTDTAVKVKMEILEEDDRGDMEHVKSVE